MNNNEDRAYQYLGDAAKVALRGKGIVLSMYSRKEERMNYNFKKFPTQRKYKKEDEGQKPMNEKQQYKRDNQQNEKIF